MSRKEIISAKYPKKQVIKRVNWEICDHESETNRNEEKDVYEESACAIMKSCRAVHRKNRFTMNDNMAVIDTRVDDFCLKSELV